MRMLASLSDSDRSSFLLERMESQDVKVLLEIIMLFAKKGIFSRETIVITPTIKALALSLKTSLQLFYTNATEGLNPSKIDKIMKDVISFKNNKELVPELRIACDMIIRSLISGCDSWDCLITTLRVCTNMQLFPINYAANFSPHQ